MARALSLLLAVLLHVVPAPAFAKAIEDVLLGADAQDVMITVLSDQLLNPPVVRSYAGSVRVRLYDAKETPQLKIEGDGGAVRSVDVGTGSDKSAAIVVNFTDKTRLAPSDVRVEREPGKIVLRIARGLLPAMAGGAPTAQKEPPAQVQEPQAPAANKPAPVPAPAAQAPGAAPAARAPAGQGEPAAKAAPAKKPAQNALGTAKSKPDDQGLGLAKDTNTSAVPMLLAVSALLALCYGAIRLVMKKNGASDIPAIDVIAQKRLGPRHQLVIVRAFDRDYLLSIQGGQTTVVARSSRKRSDDADAMSPLPFPRAPEGGLDLPPPSGSLRPNKAASSPAPVRNGLSAARDFEDDEVTFGGELFKAALEQRERARDQNTNARLEAARAEARAELARLESEREEPASARGSLLGGKTSLPGEEAREDELVEMPPRAADALMSESVSGLLKLRRASGR